MPPCTVYDSQIKKKINFIFVDIIFNYVWKELEKSNGNILIY